MSRRNTTSLEFDAIAIEGGLLPAEWLAKVAQLAAPHQKPEDYAVPKGLNLRDELGRYWHVAKAHWEDFQLARNAHANGDAYAASQRLLTSLLRDVFGANDLSAATSPLVIAERSYPISASARGGRLPMVIAAFDQRLDAREVRFGDTGRQRSAFGLLQDYLNASDDSLWGIVSNGLSLRLVRDNASLTRPAWVEADLERIFGEDRFPDFSLLWLLIHASRFGHPDQLSHQCPLEAWRDASREQGTRAREQLRTGVEEALAALGQGFVSEPGNESLRSALASGQLTPMAYFQQLLRLVYRLIFLLTIEERGLLHPPGSETTAITLYADGYSLRRLRERSRKRRAYDRHHDIWQGLKPVMAGLATGQPILALPALGGLFSTEQCANLDDSELGNAALLGAVFKLSWLRGYGSLTRINWRDMGPEEFGSVYESLLELVPSIAADGRRFAFASAEQSKGNTRKTSGSYYTPDSLVQELLDSALEPVIAQRIAAAADPQAALLSITVCDPACGSGHFLLAAARRLATHLARLRAQGTPSGEDFRHALRDVITHCIFGVDVNPMALELARMSLWLEAMTPDRPLGFLDHHLQCGDALLGVLDPAILNAGIPDDAYAPLTGDARTIASEVKKRNKRERDSWQRALDAGDLFRADHLAEDTSAIEQLTDDNLAAVAVKQLAWHRAENAAHNSRFARLADLFVGAFLLPKVAGTESLLPTSRHLWAVANNQLDESLTTVEDAARRVCSDARVLHWWLAFPQVAKAGGFSVMLGNPPWERIKLQEEEFFAARSPSIASAINKAERSKRIELLRQGRLLKSMDGNGSDGLPPSSSEQALHRSFELAKRSAEATSSFVHASSDMMRGRYPLTGIGDVNTYALFSETFFQLVEKYGYAGFIVPTGIATDDTTKAFFRELVETKRLRSFFGFKNERFLFAKPVEHTVTFGLMTFGGSSQPSPTAEFCWLAYTVAEMRDLRRRVVLRPSELLAMNPNTRTAPVFRTEKDATLTSKIYRTTPIFVREPVDINGTVEPETNPWGISFQTMFHMSNDSGLFHTTSDQGAHTTLPLYEAKMIHQFDHRWATYVETSGNSTVETADVSDACKAAPDFAVRPRYWVDQYEVLARVARVPRGLAKAWLAVHQQSEDGQRREALQALWPPIAQWIAGECFRREAGAPQQGETYSDAQKLQAAPRAQRSLATDYPACDITLREAGLTVRKAPDEFAKWARQDADLRLSDDELATLRVFATQPAGEARNDALHTELDAWIDRRSPRWLMGWRDICRSTDERTVIASVIPRAAVGNKIPLLFPSSDVTALQAAALLANLSSLTLDFVARQKIGGTTLNYFYMKQFPVLTPDHYTDADLSFIVPRVLELTYTAHDLADWARDLGYVGIPFAWDPDRRSRLRAELDAYYARLYGLTRDELRYVLDPAEVMGEDYPSETFRVLKKNDIALYGEYRTQRLVLHEFDRMALADASGVAYQSLLVPVPGAFQEAVYSAQGVVTNSSEAICAGFVLSLIKQSQPSLVREELSQALAWFSVSQDVRDRVSSERLQQLMNTFPVSTMVGLAPRLQGVLRSLESSGAIRVEQQGAAFHADANASVPDWVQVDASSYELAGLVLDQTRAMQRAARNDNEGQIEGRKEA